VLLFVAPLPAQDKPKPDTPEQAADKVLAAFKAEDRKALKALAEKDNPDPWLVADELCFRGEHDAAEAFAKAAPRKDVEKLPAYVTSRRGKPPNTGARKALAATDAALRAKDPEAALQALEGLDEVRDDVVGYQLLYARARALRDQRRFADSAHTFLTAADRAESAEWHAAVAHSLSKGALCAAWRSDYAGAVAAWTRAAAIEEMRGDRLAAARARQSIGSVYMAQGRLAEALECYDGVRDVLEELGDRNDLGRLLGNKGQIHCSRGELSEARRCLERAAELFLASGNRRGHAAMLGSLAAVLAAEGRFREALAAYEKAAAVQAEVGDDRGLATTFNNMGECQQEVGAYSRAFASYQRALDLSERREDRAGVAKVLSQIGSLHAELGEYAEALVALEKALRLRRAIDQVRGIAETRGDLGLLRMSMGNFARALADLEASLSLFRKLGMERSVAAALGNLGLLYANLGDVDRAVALQKQALARYEELGDPAGVGRTLGSLGADYDAMGRYDEAAACFARALEQKRAVGDRPGILVTQSCLAMLDARRGHPAKALAQMQEIAARMEEQHMRRHALVSLEHIARLQAVTDAHDDALATAERAHAIATKAGDHDSVVSALAISANIHLARGAPRQAAAAARRAVGELPSLVRGLADEQGARMRGQFAGLFATGLEASRRLGDVDAAGFFLESGRAGSLLEALGGRRSLLAVTLPPDLRREESLARRAEAEAVARHRRACAGGDLKAITNKRRELETVRGRVREAIARIQRAAKAAADVVYPKADPLEEIREHLRKGEALLVYSLLSEEAIALVVTAKDAGVVPLGETDKIVTACKDIQSGVVSSAARRITSEQPTAAPSRAEAVSRLSKLVVEPLGLGKDVKRLLISPHGALSYVPFALLAGGRDVVMVPSGTTYGVLLDERTKRGEGVLALGDPEYGVKTDERAMSIVRPGEQLLPLPGTGPEAKAVGDMVLLGRDASESGLQKAIAAHSRWRSVHFACHGLIRADQPQLSSLALTPDAENDGFLTVLEVFRMKIRADLVVLSACETAKGKVYKAEGIVGFTRAFMMAGAPRVIVSLWKVDDEATQALMVKFYELWNPKEGKGLPTATALKQAQEFVASHEKWKHPYYWAAWQLWGLGD